MAEEHSIAVFIDLENVAIGVQEAKLGRFDISRVLRRLVEKGNIVAKRAYADWSRWNKYKRDLFEAGVELVEMPSGTSRGKNSADIRMVVDALELSYTKPHIDVFALVTGDSDFSPLIARLRENNKVTIGCGVKQSTSKLLIDGCDEFIVYDDLVRQKKGRVTKVTKLPEKKREGFELLLEAVNALEREGKNLHSSLVKDTMRRLQPQFNEEYHGYSSFTKLLEDAAQQKLIALHRDARSGTYIVDEVLV